MIVNEKDAAKRLNSPMNLINRLKNSTSSRNNAMSLFGIGVSKQDSVEAGQCRSSVEVELESPKPSFNPFIPPPPETKLEDILDNHDSQIKLGLAHDTALELLNASVKMLSGKLDDVRADKLPAVISAASKTVESIRKERAESAKNGKDREVHYHFYTPEQKKVSEYKIIDVT